MEIQILSCAFGLFCAAEQSWRLAASASQVVWARQPVGLSLALDWRRVGGQTSGGVSGGVVGAQLRRRTTDGAREQARSTRSRRTNWGPFKRKALGQRPALKPPALSLKHRVGIQSDLAAHVCVCLGQSLLLLLPLGNFVRAFVFAARSTFATSGR